MPEGRFRLEQLAQTKQCGLQYVLVRTVREPIPASSSARGRRPDLGAPDVAHEHLAVGAPFIVLTLDQIAKPSPKSLRRARSIKRRVGDDPLALGVQKDNCGTTEVRIGEGP
jgi:hypothetical protein